MNNWLTNKLEPLLTDDAKVFGKPMEIKVVNKFGRETFHGNIKEFLEQNLPYYIDQQIEQVSMQFGLNITDLKRRSEL